MPSEMALVAGILDRVPRPVIEVLSRAKAGARNLVAARRYAPLIADLFPRAQSSELLVANDDAAVFRVETATRQHTILKIASTPVADDLLASEAAALTELQGLTVLGEWRSIVASVEMQGSHDDGTWFTQTNLEGTPTSKVDVDAAILSGTCAEALAPVHRATAQTLEVDRQVLDELIGTPLATIAKWRPDARDDLSRIDEMLRAELGGRSLEVSRMHGDFAPTNVLWFESTGVVSGIVDWKFGTDRLPPEVDLVHYPLSLIMARSRAEYGTTVLRLLDGTKVSDGEAAAIRAAVDRGPNRLDSSLAIKLAWLQHISFGLHKAHDLRTNPIWLRNNIDNVIVGLASGA